MIMYLTQLWGTVLPMLEWLFSWEVTSWAVGLLTAFALGLLALDDYKAAKLFFLIAAADAAGGVVMWGTKARIPTWQLVIAVFILVGGIGALTVLALRYVDSKRQAKEAKSDPASAESAKEVAPDETKPNFVFGVGDSVNTYVPDKDQTMMFIDAQILNRGANSAVIFHQPHYKSPTLDSDVNMLSLSQPRAIVFPNENKTLILKHSNLITTKVASGLLKGQSARGRLAIGIPGDRLKEIGSGATVSFTIEDFTGKPYLITYQSGPSDSTMRLTIVDDEEVEEKARDITPAAPLPKPSVTVMAYLQPAAPYDVQILAGIMWQKQYVDVRLDLANGAAAIRNLDFVVRLDTSIAGIGQLSQFPGITAFPAKSMSPAWLQGTDPQGNAVAVPLTPIPGTMSTAPVYRVHCSELFANTVVHLVIASIAINQPTAQGGMPQQLFAPRRAPKTIQIKGQYAVQDGTILKSYPLEFSYQFPQQTLEAPKETPKKSAVQAKPEFTVTDLASLTDAQRAALKHDLGALGGNSLRLITIGSNGRINTARQAAEDIFQAWSVENDTIGMTTGGNVPEGFYLTSANINSEVTREVFAIFQRYGVNLPLMPDAYMGPQSIGQPNGVAIVLH